VTTPLTDPLTDVPGRNEPANLALLDGKGNPAGRVKVWTELGVPIYFNPQSREFTAHLSEEGSGRGSTSELSAGNFDALLMRIRERCLVVPVEAYRLSINDFTDDEAKMVEVTPCTVIEYHPRRLQPYIVKVSEPWQVSQRSGTLGPVTYVPRIRSVDQVYLPQPQHIEAILAAVRAVRAEQIRHRDEERRLKDALNAAIAAVPKLMPSDLKHVQETGQQAAVPPHEVGALVFDLADDPEGD
jgi:hypothetical protein